MDYEIASTESFAKWLKGLKDRHTRNKVLARLARVEGGNFGDFKALGGELYELRFVCGGGLRIYYTLRGCQVVLLICGGNKSSQPRDIEKARQILERLE